VNLSFRKTVARSAIRALMVLTVASGTPHAYSQTPSATNQQETSSSSVEIPPAVAKELQIMKERIAQLEAQLATKNGRRNREQVIAPTKSMPTATAAAAESESKQAETEPAAPFAFAPIGRG
jgi:hypothetical protein